MLSHVAAARTLTQLIPEGQASAWHLSRPNGHLRQQDGVIDHP